MTPEQYYQAPPQEVFDEIKIYSMEIWASYDDTYGYATKKMARIKDLENVQDNAWYMVAMFDQENQGKLLSKVSEKTRSMILDAIRQ